MLGVQRIAGRADGADQIGPPFPIECLAQPPNMDVDGSGIDLRIVAPDRVEQPLARQDEPRVLEEMLQ